MGEGEINWSLPVTEREKNPATCREWSRLGSKIEVHSKVCQIIFTTHLILLSERRTSVFEELFRLHLCAYVQTILYLRIKKIPHLRIFKSILCVRMFKTILLVRMFKTI